jgi:cell division protease FtsH
LAGDYTPMTPNRENQTPPPQPRAWLAWTILLLVLYWLWFAGDHKSVVVQDFTVARVIAAAEKAEVVKGVIRADPTGGSNWSVIEGDVKTDKGVVPFSAQGRLTDEMLARLTATGLFTEAPASTLMTSLLLNIIPFLIVLFVLYFFFMRQVRSAGKGAMSFGKSRAKLNKEKEKITFADVAGCREAKEEVREVVDFLKDPKRFQAIGGRIPKGVLLVGSPGTGKTLIARAIAGEAEVPFFSISGSDFVEMFVGVGAARVRDMFEQARKSAPCIVFVDEIDAVGRQRGAGLGGGNDEREQTLNSLLVEMDGFDGREGVIIIAATNRPDVLDSALTRPGRFDRQVVIDLPDLQGREEILRVHAKKFKIAAAVDLVTVARNTPGFSGADLANLLNEAALTAARRNKPELDAADIDEARDKVSYGRERRRIMDDEDKRITAYHEAGHALIQAIIDNGQLPIHKVTIIPRGQSLGSTMFIPKKDFVHHTKARLLNQICCAMGGRVAEEMAIGDITGGASGDIRGATKLARHMVCDWGMSPLGMIAYGENQEHIFLGREFSRSQNYAEATALEIDREIKVIIDAQYARAQQIIGEHRAKLDLIASALLTHETIDGIHVHELMQYGEIRTPVVNPAPIVPQEPAPAAGSSDPQKLTPKADGPEGAVEGAKA